MKASELKTGDVFIHPDTSKPLEVVLVEPYHEKGNLLTVYSTDGNQKHEDLMIATENILTIGGES